MAPKIFIYAFKSIRKVRNYIIPVLCSPLCRLCFWLNGAEFQSITSSGLPYIFIALKGTLTIGNKLTLNNNMLTCETGNKSKCRIKVINGAELYIGNNVGMSGANITCQDKITIRNNVTIGIGVHIYDTDFHSLDPQHRLDPITDFNNKKTKPIIINNNVFIGANSIILKGVEIGENSIIGAGSVVNKSIPANVLAAGNPCKIIKPL